MLITRRAAITTASAGVVSLAAPKLLAGPTPKKESAASEPNTAFPAQPPELVREMVGVSHGRIDRVRELLAEHPALAKATWDWGFGDWETALGAASHTGNREIADLLIKNGARPDMFTFAMLGQLDVVKAYIAANPGIQRTLGPHGITLLSHAQAGGDAAKDVVAYLEKLGDADIGQKSLPLSEESKKLCQGEYAFGSKPDDRLVITQGRSGDLAIQRGAAGAPRALFHQGDHAFHPTGAPAVQVEFKIEKGRTASLTITDGPDRILASRVGT
jgi:ankyrin repeat protein